MRETITLDVATFKALASDSRIRIMKSLDERPKTVTELSRDLDVNKATVFEHLNVLVDTELVQRIDSEERRWVYYRLTWKGMGVIAPDKRRVAFFLALSTAFFVAGFVYLLAHLNRLVEETRAFNDLAARGAPTGTLVQAAGATPVGTLADVWAPAALLVTAGVLLALAASDFRLIRKRQNDRKENQK